MSSRAGSTFVTFLLSIPVAAAGLMALFGVPPLSSVIAATRGLSERVHSFEEVDKGDARSADGKFEEWDSATAPEWAEEGTDADQKATDLGKSDSSKVKEFARDVDALGFSKLSRDEQDDSPIGKRQGRPRFRRDDQNGRSRCKYPKSLARHSQ